MVTAEKPLAPPSRLILVGAGGFGLEVLWVVARINQQAGHPVWNVLGFVDDDPNLRGHTIEGIPVLGPAEEFLATHQGSPCYFHCALGNNRQRQLRAEQFEAAGFLPATLIDPSARVSPRAVIGEGSFIADVVGVSLAVQIGRHVLINSHTTIGHHVVIQDYVQLCPGVRVSGHCVVERLAFLGSNAAVHPGRRVGEGASVAACSFVIHHVKAQTMVGGVPAVLQMDPVINPAEAAG